MNTNKALYTGHERYGQGPLPHGFQLEDGELRVALRFVPHI